MCVCVCVYYTHTHILLRSSYYHSIRFVIDTKGNIFEKLKHSSAKIKRNLFKFLNNVESKLI